MFLFLTFTGLFVLLCGFIQRLTSQVPKVQPEQGVVTIRLPSGYCLRNYLSLRQQKELLEYLRPFLTLSLPGKRGVRLLDYCNGLTGLSNCPRPSLIFDFFATLAISSLNSLYCSGYGKESTTSLHCDQLAQGTGVSISLGSSALFFYAGRKYILQSGDVFVGDFSRHQHGVLKIFPSSSDLELSLPGCSRISLQGRQTLK